MPQRFRVALKYREPTYELGAGRKPEPFNGGSVEIVARDAVEALRLVLQRFDDAQRLSSVSWVRKVVRIQVDVLTPMT